MAKINSPFQNNQDQGGRDAAIDLIKQRIKSLYGGGKPAERPKSHLVDRFWEQNQDHPQPHTAWQQFYAGLTDHEKHSLWNDYHSVNAPSAKDTTRKAAPVIVADKDRPDPVLITNDDDHSQSFIKSKREKIKNLKRLKDKETVKETKEKLIQSVKSIPNRKEKSERLNRKRSKHHWKPLILSLSVMFFWLLAQYNPLIVAMAKQYISPGNTLRSPVIVDPSANIEIGDESKIIIPKINVDVPVVYDLGTRDEVAIQNALEDGVVHYAGTSKPGQAGNNVIVGHSSNNFLNSGKYKFAFVLLDRLELNDTFILHDKGIRYVYKVTNKQVVQPNDFSLTLPTSTPTTTLITCTPPGTSWRRLIIQGEQISPSITAEQADTTNIPENTFETPTDAIVPGNSPSLWQRFTNWIF